MTTTNYRISIFFSTGFMLVFCLASEVSAIPINDPHAHDASAITWSQAPIPGNDPDTVNHQHNSALDIREANGSYDGYAVWDSEQLLDGPRDPWRFDPALGNGGSPATFGHGYIGDDFLSAIEYAFVGAGWNDNNKALVNSAFQQWEIEAKTRVNGNVTGQGGALVRRAGTKVGINFDEDTTFTAVNFEIRWAAIGGAGLAAEWYPADSPADAAVEDLELVFNTGATFNNAGSNSLWDSDPEANEWDFTTVALHEIGHVIGLDHFAAGDGTNLMSDSASSFGTGVKRRFIDTSDLQGAIDLYSVTVPLPLPAVLFSSGIVLLGWLGRRRPGRQKI